VDPIELIREGKVKRYFRATRKLNVPSLVMDSGSGFDNLLIIGRRNAEHRTTDYGTTASGLLIPQGNFELTWIEL
jgi:hypothetical protein